MALILVTGSSGLIGSEVADYFCTRGHEVHGIDNDMRSRFFGTEASTASTCDWLRNRHRKNFVHHPIDVRNFVAISSLFSRYKPKLIVHAAGQPSHDLAAQIPGLDWDVNANATMLLLQEAHRHVPESPFVFLSTNKVYGDGPNNLRFLEHETRWDFDDSRYFDGINERFQIDQCKHSLFGASKLAADILVQEYGNYFGMPTCCLRCGCLTGPRHTGVQLHGFLNYLVRCNVMNEPYSIFGYKGKQVRDNLHAHDVAKFIDAFWASPRPGQVYNLGGGRRNSCSILEAFSLIELVSGKKMSVGYHQEPRSGDHICYISDTTKAQRHYPEWHVSIPLSTIIEQIHEHYAKPTS